MARRVFFSFHYERDIWRASQVRNSWITKPDREAAGFWDAATWEAVKRLGDEAIRRWIIRQLDGTSVTAVLIGYETASRKYVNVEIDESFKRGNGFLGIYIHNLKDDRGMTDLMGLSPFNTWYYTDHSGSRKLFSTVYSTYDWVWQDGYNNFGTWVEKAARDAGK
jgi:hypothetical protein